MLREKVQTYVSKNITATSSGNTTVVIPVNDFDSFIAKLVVTTLSGTSPTLDVYIQTTDDGGTTWFDAAHFTQYSAASTNPNWMTIHVEGGDGVISTLGGEIGDATIAASKTGVPLMDKLVRIKYVYGGTVGVANWTLSFKFPHEDGEE